MRALKFNVSILLFVFVFISSSASANLLIKPFRVVMDEKNRTAEVTLLNNSDSTKTYNIGWVEKQQSPEGGYIDLEDETPLSASPYIRHSPRKVTIKPKEYQKIKLRLKMPANMKSGEYRSHLMMKVVESAQPKPVVEDEPTKGMKIQIIPQLSFSIPVMIRKGASNTASEIKAISVVKDDKNMPQIDVLLQHSGDYSSYGSLYAYMKVGGGKTQEIGEAHNIAIFRETSARKARIKLQVPQIPKGAVVQVLYKGDDEFEGKILGKAAIRYN